VARHRSEPLILLATSFALVGLLDALDGERIATPARTRVMLTGGFKGKTEQVDEARLRSALATALGTTEDSIIGEYGMTELSSQLFEHRPPAPSEQASGAPSWWQKAGPPGTYFPPPWLKVRAVDPTTYLPQPEGTPGLAHFIDLCNVDSCLSIVTQDEVVVESGGIRLLGRTQNASPRGCSLPFETFVRVSSAWGSS
jgi:hypothetical protein